MLKGSNKISIGLSCVKAPRDTFGKTSGNKLHRGFKNAIFYQNINNADAVYLEVSALQDSTIDYHKIDKSAKRNL